MRRPVLLAALTAFAVRALVLARFRFPSAAGGQETLAVATSLAQGHGLAVGGRLTAQVPVGYPALVACAMHLGAHGIDAARAVNILAATGAAALAAVLGHRVAGARGAYLAGMVAALEPGATLYCTAADVPIALGACLAAVVAAATSSARSEHGAAAVAGFCTGAAALIATPALLLAPWIGAMAATQRRKRTTAAAIAVAAAVLMIAPWCARNTQVLGAWVLSTDHGAELVAGTFDDDRDPQSIASLVCPHRTEEVARAECAVRVARRRIAADPIGWARRGLVRVAASVALEDDPAAFLASGLGLLDGRHEHRIAVVCTVAWWIVIVSAFVGVRRASRRGGRALAIAHLGVGMTVLELLARFYGAAGDRFHLALVPILAPLCAGILLPSRPIDTDPELVWVT